jgi:hypothetical protein
MKMVTSRGGQIVSDNSTVKNYLPAFTDQKAFSITNEMSHQFGFNFDIRQRKITLEERPKSFGKDASCSMSMRVYKSPHQDSSLTNDIFFTKKISRKNTKISRRESMQMSARAARR